MPGIIIFVVVFIIVIANSSKANKKSNYARRTTVNQTQNRPPVGQQMNRPVQQNSYRPPVGQQMNRPPVQQNSYRPPVGQQMNRPPVQQNTYRPPVGQQVLSEQQRIVYSAPLYHEDEHPRLVDTGIVGMRHEVWMPVGKGCRIVKCGYCGAENEIGRNNNLYKCYFCWKKL